jgi:hypothetical protein
MKVAIIGPSQSGKSTIFSAITAEPPDPAKAHLEQTQVIKVPDERLTYLTGVYKPKKTTEATLELTDFPGMSSSDEAGRDRFRKLLPLIRQCDLLVAVVRGFESASGQVDPQKDVEALNEDLIFADLETVSNRVERLQAALKKPTKRHDEEKRELAILERCQAGLEEMKPLSEVLHGEDEAKLVSSFRFLTESPLIVVVNVSEDQASSTTTPDHAFAQAVTNVCASGEAEIAQLDEADRAAFLEDLGLTEPARDRLIRTCYEATGLISFLTSGEDEVRAWPIRKGISAVDAAGKIHSDIARGFIRAETVAYDDLFAADGDMKAVKAAGKVRQEGKDYVVADGDIINFKFNV